MKKKTVLILTVLIAVLTITALYLQKNNRLPFFKVTEITSQTTATAVAETTTVPETTEPQLDFNCRAAMLCRADDSTPLYEKSPDAKIYPASLTKLLTICTALKYVPAETVFDVGTELQLLHEHSSLCYISRGQKVRLSDLIAGMLLVSGNDAAYTTAVNIARRVSVDKELTDSQAVRYFTDLMNETAKEIGMTHSHFSTPDGWDDEDQYSTPSDLMKLSQYVIQYPVVAETAALQKKDAVFESGETITWKNTNKLIREDSKYYTPEAIGLKTGTTDNAGRSLISAFKKDGKTYICVVVGCKGKSNRYRITKDIFNAYAK